MTRFVDTLNKSPAHEEEKQRIVQKYFDDTPINNSIGSHQSMHSGTPAHKGNTNPADLQPDGIKVVDTSPEDDFFIFKYANTSDKSVKRDRCLPANKKLKVFFNLLKLVIIALILFTVIISEISIMDSKNTVTVFGYSALTMKSDSMTSVIPKGSFIIIKRTNPEKIDVGDDIAFIRRKDDTVITHRVIQIYDNTESKISSFGFRTQGVDNPVPDKEIVYDADLIGVVKLVIPNLGKIIEHALLNLGLVLMLVGMFIVLTYFIRRCRFLIRESVLTDS